MSSSRTRDSRRDLAVTWLGTLGLYAFALGPGASASADAAFALAALLVSARRWVWLGLLTPALLAAFGELSPFQALAAAGLMLVGPVLSLLMVAVLGLPGHLLRSSDNRLARAGAMRLIGGWAWRLLALLAVLATLLSQGILAAAAVTIPAAMTWRGRLVPGAVLALAVGAATGWSLAPLILAALCSAAVAWRGCARVPPVRHPFPAVAPLGEPATWLRVQRAQRRIRRGDLIRARSILTAARRPSSHCALRLAFLDVEERSYQSALSLGAELDHGPERRGGSAAQLRQCAALLHGRGLSGVAQFQAAAAVYRRLLDEGCDWRLWDAYVRVLLAENALAAGEAAGAREHAEAALAATPSRPDYFLRLRACCVLAESAIGDRTDELGFAARVEVVESEMLAARWVTVALRRDPARLVRALFGRHGSVHQYFVRADTLSRRGGELEDETGWDPQAVAIAMAVARCSDDLIELLLGEAHRAGEQESYGTRLQLAGRALMELDATRYLLAAQSARTSWSRRFQRALGVALDAAHREGEHARLAELLEFARVQALPAATGEAAGDFALSTPPVIQLRGRTHLARPGEPNRPAPVALESAAARAAGPGAWWLSYWEAEDWLYWGLTSPAASKIHSGRVSISPRSDLAAALASLRRALPQLLAGEDSAGADFRIAASPLLCDPGLELELALRLGAQLLPAELVAAARAPRRDGARLALAIAPSASLGVLPWGLLATRRTGGGHERLLELCDWVLAPSAALVARAQGAAKTRPAPLALSVADTTERAPLGALPGARAQAQALPGSVCVLGAGHWTDDVASLAAFERQLERLGADITVAFFCHAVRGSSAEPSGGGLVMAASPAPVGAEGAQPAKLVVLTPARIFAMAARGTPIPAQVLLAACDTSALSDAASGEWLTLAPAWLASGSREVIATLYPTLDVSPAEDPLIAAALAGTSLSEALASMQRANLARWECGQAKEPAHTPLAWAAYAPIHVVGEVPVDACAADGRLQLASARFIRVLGAAIKESREGRGTCLHSGFLLSAVLDETGIADLLDGGGNSLRPSTFIWSLAPYAFSRWLGFNDHGARRTLCAGSERIDVSATLVQALQRAVAMASSDGVLVEPEHLLAASLQTPSAARRILRLLSSLTHRHVELTQRALSHTLADAISTGQQLPSPAQGPSARHRALAAAFAALGPQPGA